MNQSITNLLSGNIAGALWYGAGGAKISTDQAGMQPFDQTLLSMLINQVKPEGDTPDNPLLTGVTLTETVNVDGNVSPEEQSLNELVDVILSQLQQLDEALQRLNEEVAEDQGVFAALQSWIHDITQLLQNDTAASIDSMDSQQSLPVLAQRPETMKFAVQDALLQLITASKLNLNSNSFQEGNKNTALEPAMIKSALESLNNLLSNAGLSKTTEQAAPSLVVTHASALLGKETTGMSAEGHKAVDSKQSDALVRLVEQKPTMTALSMTASTGTDLSNHKGEDGGASTPDYALHSGNVITAGQLAMRGTHAVPLLTAQTQPVPVEQFGQEMGKFLVGKFDIINTNGLSEAKITLFPEHLGQVDVKISMHNGVLTAQFMTEHVFAKESLEAQMAQLRIALQSQGLQVNKLEVTQNSALSSQMYQDGRQSGSGTDQQRNNKRREVMQDEDAMVIHDLSDVWNEWISGTDHQEGHPGTSFTARV